MAKTEIKTLFQRYLDGELEAGEYVAAETSAMLSLQDRMKPVDEIIKRQREQIGMVVNQQGRRMEIPGIGTWLQASDGVTVSWNKDRLEALLRQLVEMGEIEISKALLSCREESTRKGSLRFNPAKESE